LRSIRPFRFCKKTADIPVAYVSKFAQVEGLSRLVNLLVAALASVETVEHDLMTGVGT
jgi:hypothetical protein